MLNDYGIEYYASRAEGGFGCVNLGEAKMDNLNSIAHDAHIDLTQEAQLQRLHRLNIWAHAWGAKTGIEFNHNGHFALPEYCHGMQPMSASARLMPNGNQVREMNEDDLEQVADAYASAALMAKRGGFDQIVLHYGHGWLMAGFFISAAESAQGQIWRKCGKTAAAFRAWSLTASGNKSVMP